MYSKKVDITRLNTNNIKTLTDKETKELFIKYQNGDNKAKDILVESNLKLVLSILKRFNTTEDNINDMFQIGCIGLIKAIDNFDLSVGVKFSTYAVPLILGEIKRAYRDSNPIRVSRGIKDLAYKIIEYKEKYLNIHGIYPTNEQIAKKLNIKEYLISYCLTALKEPISIYSPIYNDGGDTIFLYEQLKTKEQEYDKETLIALKKGINNLKERERKIIINRYFIGKTQTELAEHLGISQAQISRLETNALNKLKKTIR